MFSKLGNFTFRAEGEGEQLCGKTLYFDGVEITSHSFLTCLGSEETVVAHIPPRPTSLLHPQLQTSPPIGLI